MNFIDIEQRSPKGREFSDEIHRSTLIIHKTGLQVLGVISHGVLIRPASSLDRDELVTYLDGLDYDA